MKRRKFCLQLAGLGYTLLVVYLLLGRTHMWFPEMSFFEYFRTTSNIQPFKTITGYVIGALKNELKVTVALENTVGNFLLFIPFGIIASKFTTLNRRKLYF